MKIKAELLTEELQQYINATLINVYIIPNDTKFMDDQIRSLDVIIFDKDATNIGKKLKVSEDDLRTLASLAVPQGSAEFTMIVVCRVTHTVIGTLTSGKKENEPIIRDMASCQSHLRLKEPKNMACTGIGRAIIWTYWDYLKKCSTFERFSLISLDEAKGFYRRMGLKEGDDGEFTANLDDIKLLKPTILNDSQEDKAAKFIQTAYRRYKSLRTEPLKRLDRHDDKASTRLGATGHGEKYPWDTTMTFHSSEKTVSQQPSLKPKRSTSRSKQLSFHAH